jgi:hypothetical protein
VNEEEGGMSNGKKNGINSKELSPQNMKGIKSKNSETQLFVKRNIN